MTWIWVVLAILALLSLLLFCPLYMHVYYDGDIKVCVQFLFLKFNIPIGNAKSGRKKNKKNKSRSKTAKKKNVPAEKLPDQIKRIKDTLILFKKYFLKAFLIKRFKVQLTVATGDPCTTALLYGTINTLVYSVVNIIDAVIPVYKHQIAVDADFENEKTTVVLDVIFKTFLYKLPIGLILFILDGKINLKEKKEN